MPTKKAAPKKSAPAIDEADPRFLPVAKALARTAGLSLMESKSGGTRGLMLHGKSFGMSSHGRFVLKLTDERAKALIADGTGKAFNPAPGRMLKGWIEITHPKADWVALAKEALRIAQAARKSAGKPVPSTARKTKTKARKTARPRGAGRASGSR